MDSYDHEPLESDMLFMQDDHILTDITNLEAHATYCHYESRLEFKSGTNTVGRH